MSKMSCVMERRNRQAAQELAAFPCLPRVLLPKKGYQRPSEFGASPGAASWELVRIFGLAQVSRDLLSVVNLQQSKRIQPDRFCFARTRVTIAVVT